LTVRKHFIADGEGHLSPHYDVISYDATLFPEYESLGVDKLESYKDFLSAAISACPTIGNTELINMLEQKHGVTATNSSMAQWRRRTKRLIAAMARQELVAACDTFDAMNETMGPAAITIEETIDATTGDGFTTEVAMEANSLQDSTIASGGAITVCATGADGTITDGAITDGAPIEPSIGICPTASIGAIDPPADSVVGDKDDLAGVAITGGSIGDTDAIVGATLSIESPLAADDGSMNRPTRRARPFYGPDIDPDQAFILSGDGAAAMGSGTVGAPTKAGATMAKQKAKKRTIDSTSMAPLPFVKPIVHEEWLQNDLNERPAIGDKLLLKALVQAMHVTFIDPSKAFNTFASPIVVCLFR
jgi:hypothetical protein